MKNYLTRLLKIIIVFSLIISTSFIFVVKTAFAQDPLVSLSWHVKAVDDHYDNKPKISTEFGIPKSGIIRVEEKIMPYLSLGKAGHQYWIIQHRLRGSSAAWENGVPYKKDLEVRCTPEPRIDKKNLECVYKYESLPGIEKYIFRVLLIPNFYWTGSANHTPEQALAVSVNFIYGKTDDDENNLSELNGSWTGDNWGNIVINSNGTVFSGTYTSTFVSGEKGRFEFRKLSNGKYSGTWNDPDGIHKGTIDSVTISPDGNTIKVIWKATDGRNLKGTSTWKKHSTAKNNFRLIVYQDIQYQGKSLVITGDVPRLGELGFNDGISSYRVTGGTWLLCEHYDYQGECFEVSSDNSNLLKINWNDKISSIRRIR